MTKTFTNQCIHPKGDQPASFDMGEHMCVDRMTITYRSGQVGSAGDGSAARFGNRDNAERLNIVVAKDKAGGVLLPTQDNTMGFTSQGDGAWFSIDDTTSSSDSIVFQIKDGVYDFKMEGQHTLWYGEDLVDYTEEDNIGGACFDIEVTGEYC